MFLGWFSWCLDILGNFSSWFWVWLLGCFQHGKPLVSDQAKLLLLAQKLLKSGYLVILGSQFGLEHGNQLLFNGW